MKSLDSELGLTRGSKEKVELPHAAVVKKRCTVFVLLEELVEGDWVTLLLSQACTDHVRRSSNQGTVS